ncbi:MAG: hypothetical protein WBD87_05165 [Candidatus Acidiferrales bacterium]
MTKIMLSVKRGAGWVWQHKVRTVGLLVILLLAAPKPVKSQFLDPCCAIMAAGLNTIGSTLGNVIGGGLGGILSIEQDIARFEQTMVWPQTLINQARSLVAGLQGTFNQMGSVMHIPVNSATLPATQQLEQNLLSRNPSQIAQTSTEYASVYGTVPSTGAASPQTRDMVDMTDAAAQAALKRAIEIDALADLELQAANQINQSIAAAAPGSAPIIEAQADAWLVRANAYTQAATADLMRVRAIDLADASASVKNGAANAAAIQKQIYNLLKRP